VGRVSAKEASATAGNQATAEQSSADKVKAKAECVGANESGKCGRGGGNEPTVADNNNNIRSSDREKGRVL
jgi:hypothetical protein